MDFSGVERRLKPGAVLPAVTNGNVTVTDFFFTEEPPVNRSALKFFNG
jgi:hypothetical protein